MPITPLHYPFAYLISKTNRKFSLPGLVVGSVIPDIEVPIMWVFFNNLPDHLFLHSLIGAMTVGTLLAIVVTRFLYPVIISSTFNLPKEDLAEVCRITPWFIASCFIGVMSHLVLDYPMHWYNPILWPWVNPFDVIGPLVLLFMPAFSIQTAFFIARTLTHIAMIVLWIGIGYRMYSKGDLWYRHWVGDPPTEPAALFNGE
ncbi:MAG: DUF4184 family protein [Candidatus Thorarchaeota archaeon]|nr:DUF4184 family protein [Candidatus Thorarchaeota archaeon]